jgi:hypothetical protein
MIHSKLYFNLHIFYLFERNPIGKPRNKHQPEKMYFCSTYNAKLFLNRDLGFHNFLL